MRWISAFGIVILCFAGGLGAGRAHARESLPEPGQFSHPNETQPVSALPILYQAPQGAYVSVGTERGLISASLSSRFSALVLADIDPGIVFQNKLNLALILMSNGSRQEYLRLRMSAGSNAWIAAARDAHLPDELRHIVENPEAWSWWSKHIRNSVKFRPFHTRPGPGNSAYRDANYLFSDPQFARLYRMASAGNIVIMQADLTHSADLERIAKEISKRGTRLSVLDISNVADSVHSTMAGPLENIAKVFAPVAEDGSLVVETHHETVARASRISWDRNWIYRGFRFDDLKDPEKRQLISELMQGGLPQGDQKDAACIERNLRALTILSSVK